jgi:hypothetical protein
VSAVKDCSIIGAALIVFGCQIAILACQILVLWLKNQGNVGHPNNLMDGRLLPLRRVVARLRGRG